MFCVTLSPELTNFQGVEAEGAENLTVPVV
jgi:hypothetical protein